MAHKVILADYVEAKAQAGAIDIELPDGTTVRIPPRELWPDTIANAEGLVERSRVILGDEAWAKFTAAGGTAALLNSIYADHQGLDPGEPTAS